MKKTWVLIFLFIPLIGQGQYAVPDDVYRNPIRVFLNRFSTTFTVGYSKTYYRQKIEAPYFLITRNSQSIISNPIAKPNGYISGGVVNWFNQPVFIQDSVSPIDFYEFPNPPLTNPVDNPLLKNNYAVIPADTMGLQYEMNAPGIPLQLQIHYNFFHNRFRVGVGGNYEWQWMRTFTPNVLKDVLKTYTPDFKRTSYRRFYGILGGYFYDYWDFSFAGELQIGMIRAGKQFNKDLIDRGMFLNIGISIENHESEYLRWIARPYFEYKIFTTTLPEGLGTIKNNYNSVGISLGASINYPEIPRSKFPGDAIQLKHILTDPVSGRRYEVRGQPFYKIQNPKVGQNYRNNTRNKLRNRRKLDF